VSNLCSRIFACLFFYATNNRQKTNMAARDDWCGKLNNSVLFDILRKNASKLKGILQAKSILTISDGKLYVWDAYSATLLVTNLKSLQSESSSHRSIYQVKLIDSDCTVLYCTVNYGHRQ